MSDLSVRKSGPKRALIKRAEVPSETSAVTFSVPLFLAASQIASATASASANDSHALMYSRSCRICSVTPSGSERYTRTEGVSLGPTVGPVVRIIFQSDAAFRHRSDIPPKSKIESSGLVGKRRF
jgi:hypothetical protein